MSFPGPQPETDFSPIDDEQFADEVEKLKLLVDKKIENNPHYPCPMSEMTEREFKIAEIVSYYCVTAQYISSELERALKRRQKNLGEER